jgi:hypothetical protein
MFDKTKKFQLYIGTFLISLAIFLKNHLAGNLLTIRQGNVN